jgi:prolyl-tRNA synthetase
MHGYKTNMGIPFGRKKMRAGVDRMFKEIGTSACYFPLFAPKSIFEAEEKKCRRLQKNVLL